VTPHKAQGMRLRELGIGQRAAAKDLGVAASVLGRYLTTGLITRYLGGDFPARIDEYLRKKSAARSLAKFEAAPMIGSFYRLEISLGDVADAVGMDYVTLRHGIYDGRWENEAAKNLVGDWIKQRIEAKEKQPMLIKVTPPEDVLNFYGLKRDAFGDVESGDDFFETKALAGAEKKIVAAVDKQSWLAIIGEVGAGKSMLLDKCKARLGKRKDIVIVEPRVIQKENLKASHVIDAILADLGADVVATRQNLEHRARHVIASLEQASKDGKKPLVVIDEAHLLTDSALLTLKRLFEFKIAFKRLLTIILVGQPLLLKRLRGNYFLSEVAQRVDCIQLNSLDGQLSQYIEFRLQRAGLNGSSAHLFDKSAIKALAKIANTPLSVNNLCSAALIRAYDLGERVMNAEIVETAAASF